MWLWGGKIFFLFFENILLSPIYNGISIFVLNVLFASQIYSNQPIQSNGVINRLEYRALEGFVYSITPFNFTAIAGNLCAAPALMGNVSLWKPASSAILACYYLMELFQEAGLPDGVINFLPGDGKIVGDPILNNSNLNLPIENFDSFSTTFNLTSFNIP